MEKNLETEIIEALKSGKEEAFRYIYKTYYTDLCRIARGYLTDSYLSESIVEDLVYSLWENRSKITINYQKADSKHGLSRTLWSAFSV